MVVLTAKPGGAPGLERRFVAHDRWVFWRYCGLFALAHASHCEGSGWLGAIVLIDVVPQFVAAAVLTCLRLRDGLRSSIFAHSLNNAAGIGLLALGFG